MSLPEYTQISKDYTLGEYLYGRCNIFALALISLSDDAQAKYIWDSNDDGKLIHCYIALKSNPEQEYDARGLIDGEVLEAYEADFNGDDLAYFDVDSKVMLEDMQSTGFFMPDENELSEIQAFIKNNAERYGLSEKETLAA